MVPKDDDERAQIRETILRYLRDHPHAGDVASGIVRKWLPPEGFERAPDLIESVLEQMVEAKELECHERGRNIHYRRGPRHG